MAQPAKDGDGIKSIQPNPEDKSTKIVPQTNSTIITSEDSAHGVQNSSITDAEPRPHSIGTRLSGNLLKILVHKVPPGIDNAQ